VTTLNNLIRRYTSISAVIDILSRRKLSILNPSSWDDQNDRYYMELYKDKKRLGGLYGLCASQSTETYHHWRVFTGRMDGACLVIRRAQLERALKKRPEFRFGKVDYLKLDEVESLTNSDLERLPFVKRIGFAHEGEYRIIAATKDPQTAAYSIEIKLAWIDRIQLNPWLPDPLAKSVMIALKRLPGCANLTLRQSRLINNSRWKKAGDLVVQKMVP
jgi:hypothetical protein